MPIIYPDLRLDYKVATHPLEEQKQAVIHHVVTRGLDPNVRLKHSGIPGPAQSPRDTGYFAAGATKLGLPPLSILRCIHCSPVGTGQVCRLTQAQTGGVEARL
jgi:hypothetical protein